MTTLSMWPGSSSGEAARTQGFTQKWEDHLLLCFTGFSWPLSTPSPIVNGLLEQDSQARRMWRNEALSARGPESFFQKVTWETMLEVHLFSPIWQKDSKSQKAFCIICMRLRRQPVKGKVWHSSWLGPAEGAPLGVQQKWPSHVWSKLAQRMASQAHPGARGATLAITAWTKCTAKTLNT